MKSLFFFDLSSTFGSVALGFLVGRLAAAFFFGACIGLGLALALLSLLFSFFLGLACMSLDPLLCSVCPPWPRVVLLTMMPFHLLMLLLAFSLLHKSGVR